MADSEEVSQRRREKILSRVGSEQQEEAQSTIASEKSSVFDRYKLLKMKQVAEKRLVNISRYTGLLTFPLSFALSPSLAILLAVIALVYGAYSILSQNVEQSKDYDWITKKVPILSKLKHLQLILLSLKVTVNVLLSFIMATVLINAAILLFKQHIGQSEEL